MIVLKTYVLLVYCLDYMPSNKVRENKKGVQLILTCIGDNCFKNLPPVCFLFVLDTTKSIKRK